MPKPKPITQAVAKLLADPLVCDKIAEHLVSIASGKEPGDAVRAFTALRDTAEGDPHRKSLADAIIETKLIELIQRKEIVPLPLAEHLDRESSPRVPEVLSERSGLTS